MKSVLIVSPDEGLRARLLRALEDFSIFTAANDEDALKTLRVSPVDVVVKEALTPARDLGMFVDRVRHLHPEAVVVCVVPSGDATPDEGQAVDAADFVLLQPFSSRHAQDVIRQAEDKSRLMHELAALRLARPTGTTTSPGGGGSHLGIDMSAQTLAQVVKEFAKALAAGFDLPRVLNLFLDAVAEMVRPSRSAILLADQTGRQFRVAAYRGLSPRLAEAVTLAADGGLPLWLGAEGRLLYVEEVQARPADAAAREVARELSLLQALVAIPLLSHGDVVAILILGQRITGGSYSRGETEILFNLGAHLATAIRDIRVHHRLQYQKEFTDRILARMSNGVITIAPDETVVIMNRRAEEILGMSAREVLHKDLRVLPSPLGDLLYEALTRGRATVRSEVQLALRNLPLEVSTYPVMGDGADPMGAVLVFEDLTAQRQLAQERRRTEQLQLLTRIVARIADEIKNPLVSIDAFMELLGERYDDASFRQQFAGVVGRDVRRVVQILDKLAALVNEGDYKRDMVDLRAVVEECLGELGAQALPAADSTAKLLSLGDESTQKRVTVALSHEGGPFVVSGDRTMLKKAVAYVVWYLLRKTPGAEAKIAISVSRLEDTVRVIVASRTADVRAEELRGIFDPIQVVQESLIDVGPCVSQRIVEGQGGRLEAKHGRGEVSFTATMMAVPSSPRRSERASPFFPNLPHLTAGPGRPACRTRRWSRW